MAYQEANSKKEYIGLSTDDRPIVVSPGSTYHSVDTGELWVFYQDMWLPDLRLINALRTLV